MPKTVAIIQARMGSSRLPGKVLLDIAGKPMIQHVIERTRRARSLDSVIVATTTNASDDPIADFAASIGIPLTRGSLHDVLDRYYQAAKTHQAEVIVRITADCPLTDPQVIDQTAKLITNHSAFSIPHSDFACDRLPPPLTRTFPIGLDVEVCTFAALERAWKEAAEKYQREHVMPYLYEGVQLDQHLPLDDDRAMSLSIGMSMRGFRIAQLHHTPDYGNLRWTVDTPEDLELIRRIFVHFSHDDFSWQDVLALQQHQPEMFAVNIGVTHRTVFDVDERQQ